MRSVSPFTQFLQWIVEARSIYAHQWIGTWALPIIALRVIMFVIFRRAEMPK